MSAVSDASFEGSVSRYQFCRERLAVPRRGVTGRKLRGGGGGETHCRGYKEAMRGVRELLLKNTRAEGEGGLLYIGELHSGQYEPKMDHLVCFMPGVDPLPPPPLFISLTPPSPNSASSSSSSMTSDLLCGFFGPGELLKVRLCCQWERLKAPLVFGYQQGAPLHRILQALPCSLVAGATKYF